MNHEFKKITSEDLTRYVLEDGATVTTGAVATVPGALGSVKKREDNILAQEKKETPKPRNFVAKNAKMGGAGQHKDKKKAVKQGDVKHKKPLAESYAEDLAKQVFNANPNIKDENAVLDAAWPIAVKDLGNKRARSVFNYDEDFPSDLVSVYGWLQKDQQGMAEGYPKHQDLSGVSTDKLKAYLTKQAKQSVPGEGGQVKRVQAELQRREQGVAEGPSDSGFNAMMGKITDPAARESLLPVEIQKVVQFLKDSIESLIEVLKSDPDFQPNDVRNSTDLRDMRKNLKSVMVDSDPKNVANAIFNYETEWRETMNEWAEEALGIELFTKLQNLYYGEYGEGVAEGFNHEYDDEAGMAHSNLLTTARAVMGLLKTIKDRDNLPEWGQEKIAKAEMMLVSVWDYLQSQKEMGNDPKVEAYGRYDRRDAYQRDYDHSVAGMDRGNNHRDDERHDLDPSDWYIVKDGKMYKVSVYPNQEQEAMSRGYSRTRDEAKAKASNVSEVSPPGWEKTVKAMKKHDNIDNPFALAWSMKNKGYKSHKKESADPYFESLRAKVEKLAKK